MLTIKHNKMSKEVLDDTMEGDQSIKRAIRSRDDAKNKLESSTLVGFFFVTNTELSVRGSLNSIKLPHLSN